MDVDVPAGGTTVFVRVYTEAGQVAAPLTLKVDGGRPQIRSGVVAYPTTPTQRRTPLRTSRQARLIDDSHEPWWSTAASVSFLETTCAPENTRLKSLFPKGQTPSTYALTPLQAASASPPPAATGMWMEVDDDAFFTPSPERSSFGFR